jgi:hypothetical protein
MNFQVVNLYDDATPKVETEDTSIRKPTVTLEQKRQNKTSKCDKCDKYFSGKTLKYSHDCSNREDTLAKLREKRHQTREPQKEKHAVSEQPEEWVPSDDMIHQYMAKREQEQRSLAAQILQEKRNRLISRAF